MFVAGCIFRGRSIIFAHARTGHGCGVWSVLQGTTHIVASACAVCAKTLSPLVKLFTPGPAFSTVPETSQPRLAGKETGKYSLTAPDLIFTSSGLILVARVLMSTSPGPGDGSGIPSILSSFAETSG